MYHGTSQKNAESIRKDGYLDPEKASEGESGVYVTDNVDYAKGMFATPDGVVFKVLIPMELYKKDREEKVEHIEKLKKIADTTKNPIDIDDYECELIAFEDANEMNFPHKLKVVGEVN